MSLSTLRVRYYFVFTIIMAVLNQHSVRGARRRRNGEQETKQYVCYDQLGCFSKLPPFSPSMPLPMSPVKIQTEYYLRTRRNPLIDQSIIPDAANLTASHFDPSKPTKVIIHGFVMVNHGLAKWVPEVTKAILYQEDVNVIQINWVKGANVEYDHAASNTRIVGAQVGYLINLLMEVRGAKAEDFHLIGFSLGAHVAGFAGKKVREGGKKKIVGRITGLDPANPGFDYDSPKVRLDKTDADFVDIIHTDTQTILVMASGMNRNLGHIDFYPNGGADQTGCNSWTKESTWISAITDTTVCDHLRAPELFKASINATEKGKHMIGYKCQSYDKFKRGVCLQCRGSNGCRKMGYWAEPLSTNKKQMQYYLSTSGEKPFTVNHYQIQIHWRSHDSSSRFGFKAKLFVTLHGDKGSTAEVALNDAATFHVFAGRTTRFLITHDTRHDIGRIERVEFRWERPSCYSWFLCPKENILLKRIKIFDATEQRRYVYLPLGKNRSERIHSHFIKPNEKFELLSSSYIRSQYPRKYKSLDREETLKNMIHPRIVSVQSRDVLTSGERTDSSVSNTTAAPKPSTTT